MLSLQKIKYLDNKFNDGLKNCKIRCTNNAVNRKLKYCKMKILSSLVFAKVGSSIKSWS